MNFSILCRIALFILFNKTITSLKTFFYKKKTLYINNNKKGSQCVISSRNKKIYCNSEVKLFIDTNDYISDKRLITISPGGFKGFYLLGILTYIKETYNTTDLIFSGASAGSWNSLFMCYKGDSRELVYNLLNSDIKKAKSINEVEYFMKYKLLSTYKEEDFDLNKLFIGVTTFKYFFPCINIFSDFETLEDAINCCMASSHIPFVTGGLTHKYQNMFTYDGGFSQYPYLEKPRLVHISPNMWDEIDNKPKTFFSKIKSLQKISEFFSVSKNNLYELFDNGYQDAKNHKKYFDSLFINKQDIHNEDDSAAIEF
jgi:hypothetical protein